jgi:hypothetical protein
VESEDGIALVEEAGRSVRPKFPYFAEIVPFRPHEKSEPIFQIGQIVGIEGDTRRGRRPFPHPFPARMPLEVAQAAVMALSRPDRWGLRFFPHSTGGSDWSAGNLHTVEPALRAKLIKFECK